MRCCDASLRPIAGLHWRYDLSQSSQVAQTDTRSYQLVKLIMMENRCDNASLLPLRQTEPTSGYERRTISAFAALRSRSVATTLAVCAASVGRRQCGLVGFAHPLQGQFDLAHPRRRNDRRLESRFWLKTNGESSAQTDALQRSRSTQKAPRRQNSIVSRIAPMLGR